jgi:TPR repeat protein
MSEDMSEYRDLNRVMETRDHSKNVYWYSKAAKQGDAETHLMLGLSFKFGKGVEKDGNTALYWYERAIRKEGIKYFTLKLR